MIKKAIAPNPIQPIDRLHVGQLSQLATTLTSLHFGAEADEAIRASEYGLRSEALASYDGDEE